MIEKVHLTHVCGLGYGVACSSRGSGWKQTTDIGAVTCERCQDSVQYAQRMKQAAPTEGDET